MHSQAENASPVTGTIPVWSALLGVSRLHIVSIAAMAALTFGWLFTGIYAWLAVVVCALDWYVINLVNQTVDLKEDDLNSLAPVAFTRRHRRGLLWAALAIALISFPVVHGICPVLNGPRIAFHCLGALYNWPLLPGRRRLKSLYFWKNTASALGFVLTTFAYPLTLIWSSDPKPGWPTGISWATMPWALLFFFLFEISYEVIYDIRDVDGDAAAGVRTYAVVHGVPGAVHIIDGLIFSSLAILTLGFVLGLVPWRMEIMAVAPLIQFICYRRVLGRGITARDCIVFTWAGVGLLVFYNLWVVAQLPGVWL